MIIGEREMIPRYQNFDPEHADLYDNSSRLWRRLLYIVNCIAHDMPWEIFNNSRFLEIEIYLGQESLNRKMNNVYYLWSSQ